MLLSKLAGLALGGIILFAAYKIGGWQAVFVVGILGWLFKDL